MQSWPCTVLEDLHSPVPFLPSALALRKCTTISSASIACTTDEGEPPGATAWTRAPPAPRSGGSVSDEVLHAASMT